MANAKSQTDWAVLRQAIVKSFTPGKLRMVLSDAQDSRDFDTLVSQNVDYEEQVFQLIRRAEHEGWTAQLIDTLLAERENTPFSKIVNPIRLRIGRNADSDTEVRTPANYDNYLYWGLAFDRMVPMPASDKFAFEVRFELQRVINQATEVVIDANGYPHGWAFGDAIQDYCEFARKQVLLRKRKTNPLGLRVPYRLTTVGTTLTIYINSDYF